MVNSRESYPRKQKRYEYAASKHSNVNNKLLLARIVWRTDDVSQWIQNNAAEDLKNEQVSLFSCKYMYTYVYLFHTKREEQTCKNCFFSHLSSSKNYFSSQD